MKDEIVSLIKENIKISHKGLSLVEMARHDLKLTNPNGLVISPILNKIKNIKLEIRRIASRVKKEKGNEVKIIFLVYTHSHVNTLLPILSKIKDTYKIVKRDGFTNLVAKRLKKNKVRYQDIEGYGYNSKELKKTIFKLKTLFNKLPKEKKKDPLIRYLFKYYFVDIARQIELAYEMIKFENPKLLVVMNETTPLGKISVALAKRFNVKTLCIQHGGFGRVHDGFVPVKVDKIAAWGNYGKRILINDGTPKEKIVVTGAPQFDNVILKRVNLNEDFIRRLKIDKNKKIILFTTQPLPDVEKITRMVCRSVKSLDNTQLILKLHPSEFSEKIYRKILKEENVNAIITKKNLYELINISSVLITQTSTTGLEAMLFGKPVIIVNLSGEPDVMPYTDYGAAIGVHKDNELVPALKSVLYNKNKLNELKGNASKFLKDYCYKLDGKASERIAGLIRDMVIDNSHRR